MSSKQRQPSELLQEFLNYIDQVKSEYEMAHEAVGKEDKRLQDFLHELEFAKDRSERNKVSTSFRKAGGNEDGRRTRCSDWNYW